MLDKILEVWEKLRHVAVPIEVGESERVSACLRWFWQRSVPNSEQADVEQELWAQTSSLTCLFGVSEVDLNWYVWSILITELPSADIFHSPRNQHSYLG